MGCIDDNVASRRAAAVRMVVIMYLSMYLRAMMVWQKSAAM